MKNYIFISIVLVLALCLSGCFEKVPVDTPEQNSGETTAIENSEVIDDTITYNDGGDIVGYKGKVYYIEYNNNDYSKEGLRENFYKNKDVANSQRYVNVINKNGMIENLFKVTDLDSLHIIDDRFYLQRPTGMLYSVDMKGENNLDFARGMYVGFDSKNHAVYYTNANATGKLWKIDTLSMTTSNYDFDNEYIGNDYTLLGVRNGSIYYYKVDTINNKVTLSKHDIENNKNSIIKNIEIYRDDFEDILYETEADRYSITNTINTDDGRTFILYGKFEGTLMEFYYGKVIMFDMEHEKIEIIEDTNVRSILGIVDNKLVYSVLKNYESFEHDIKAYSLEDGKTTVISNNFYDINENLYYGDSLEITQKLETEIADKYLLDLSIEVSGDIIKKYPDTEGYNLYSVNLLDYTMVGNKIFYMVCSSKLNPAGFIGWRSAHIRKAIDVYSYDLSTNKTNYVYSIVNNDFEKMEEIIDETIVSGDVIQSGDLIVEEPVVEDTLKENEMYLDIKVDNIWQKEFDVRVEEVGGMIIGKRIEYEGHHKKEDGDIRIKVLKEVGAMLTVYVDNSLQSQMRIEENM